MREIIDGASFAQAMIHAAASLNLQKQQINELNVFPVPDGDTGTNMSLTLGTAAAELRKKQPHTVGEAAATNASALLRGARGNSGVILSLLFRGFAKAVKDKDSIDGRDLAIALDFGVAAAYKAVMKPAEGTILTVSRLTAARAADAARQTPNDPEAVLEAAIAEGQLALEHTTEMNPVLKKAGVVDAGGKGFLVILQGMLDSLRGVPMPEGDGEGEAKVESKTDYAAIAAEEITFTFDTVFIVRKTSPHKGLEAFEAYLNSIGDSLVIGEDDDCFKVHVHTDIPGAALTEAQKYGTLELAKIENMRTQAEDLAAGRHIQSTDDLDAVEAELEGNHGARKIAPPEKKYGVVAVAAGDGLAAVFRDLGADGVISGGQTMNPSTDDILREIDATPAEVVFVLPNNKNIIMAAEQCVRLVEGKQVVVLPTKTIPQGISALMVMDPEAEVGDNRAAMAEAIGRVHTSEITYAARDSDFDGFAIKRGDYLALTEHQLFGTDRKLEKLLRRPAVSLSITICFPPNKPTQTEKRYAPAGRTFFCVYASEHLGQKLPGALLLRIGKEGVGLVLLQNVSAVHEQDAGAHLPGEAHLVGDHHHGHALVGQLLHDLQDLAHHLGVQGGGGLIKEHDLGLHGQRPHDGDALLLAAGELNGIGVRPVLEAHPVQQLLRFSVSLLLAHELGLDRGQGDVFPNRHVGEQVEVLEHHAHLAADGIDVGLAVVDHGPLKGDCAGGGSLQQVHAAQEGGLSGAGWPDDDHLFPLLDGLGDIVQNQILSKALGQVFNGDHFPSASFPFWQR